MADPPLFAEWCRWPARGPSLPPVWPEAADRKRPSSWDRANILAPRPLHSTAVESARHACRFETCADEPFAGQQHYRSRRRWSRIAETQQPIIVCRLFFQWNAEPNMIGIEISRHRNPPRPGRSFEAPSLADRPRVDYPRTPRLRQGSAEQKRDSIRLPLLKCRHGRQANSAERKPRRRWYQFRLRTLLIGVALAALTTFITKTYFTEAAPAYFTLHELIQMDGGWELVRKPDEPGPYRIVSSATGSEGSPISGLISAYGKTRQFSISGVCGHALCVSGLATYDGKLTFIVLSKPIVSDTTNK